MWVQGSTYMHTYYQKLAKAPCLFHKAGCMYAPGLLVSVFGYMRDQYIISAGLSRFAIRSLSTAQEVVEWGWPDIIPSISTVYTRKKFLSITWAHVSQLSQYHFKSGEPYEVSSVLPWPMRLGFSSFSTTDEARIVLFVSDEAKHFLILHLGIRATRLEIRLLETDEALAFHCFHSFMLMYTRG